MHTESELDETDHSYGDRAGTVEKGEGAAAAAYHESEAAGPELQVGEFLKILFETIYY